MVMTSSVRAARSVGAWLLVLGCAATPVFAEPASATLPLTLVDNRPFVDVRVDGQGPFAFILDTGSSSTTLSAELAKRLQLPVTSSGTDGGAGEQSVSFPVVRVAQATAGPFTLSSFDAPAMDMARLAQVVGFQQLEGVLGIELFQHHVVTLDPAHGSLRVEAEDHFRPPTGAVEIPIALDENQMPIVTATVNGVTGAFQIDTGDRSSLTLFGGFWREHALDHAVGPSVTAMTGYGIGGPIRGIVGRPASFAIGSVALPPPVTRLSLQKSGAFTRADHAGNIGMGILKRFVVSFDYAHHAMWLSKGAWFDQPDRYDRSGLWLALAPDNGIEVLAVTPGSAAAAAGMRPGDLIISVDDRPAGAANLFEIRERLQSLNTASVAIVARRAGALRRSRLALRDQIAPPSPAHAG